MLKGISHEIVKSIALKDISTVLAKEGKVDEALECAKGINSNYKKFSALKNISTELSKQSKVDEAASVLKEALVCIRGISDKSDNSIALKEISTELAKQGKVDKALSYARGISYQPDKNSALKDISNELARQGNWALAESTGLEIPQLKEKHSCWKTIAKNNSKEHGWQRALQQVQYFQSEEARSFYLKGWSKNVTINDLTEELLLYALPLLKDDSESLEHLLQTHAINELFFGEATNEEIQQYNRILNIQWAMDIKAQFNQNKGKMD